METSMNLEETIRYYIEMDKNVDQITDNLRIPLDDALSKPAPTATSITAAGNPDSAKELHKAETTPTSLIREDHSSAYPPTQARHHTVLSMMAGAGNEEALNLVVGCQPSTTSLITSGPHHSADPRVFTGYPPYPPVPSYAVPQTGGPYSSFPNSSTNHPFSFPADVEGSHISPTQPPTPANLAPPPVVPAPVAPSMSRSLSETTSTTSSASNTPPASVKVNENQDASGGGEKSDNTVSSGKARRRRQVLPNKDNLVCVICTDKANGYNFGAITCESCKAFFRRNAHKTEKAVCQFENNCKLDPHSRKFCTACRLTRCFEKGMKKEWILDDDTLKKRKRIAKRTTTNDKTDLNACSSSDTTGSAGSAVHVLSSDEAEQLIPLSEEEESEINIILRNHQVLDNALQHNTGTAAYNGQADALRATNDRGYGASAEEFEQLSSEPKNANQLVNMASGFVRRLIGFNKTLPHFFKLDTDDQVALIKGGLMETFMLRSAIQYDRYQDGFVIRNNDNNQTKQLDLNVIKQQFGEQMHHEHMKFVRALNEAADWNKPTMILVMIINLFSQDRPNLKAKETVGEAEEKYSHLLQAYLRSKYSRRKAELMLPKILITLTHLRDYAELAGSHMSQLPLDGLDPLLGEILMS